MDKDKRSRRSFIVDLLSSAAGIWASVTGLGLLLPRRAEAGKVPKKKKKKVKTKYGGRPRRTKYGGKRPKYGGRPRPPKNPDKPKYGGRKPKEPPRKPGKKYGGPPPPGPQPKYGGPGLRHSTPPGRTEDPA